MVVLLVALLVAPLVVLLVVLIVVLLVVLPVTPVILVTFVAMSFPTDMQSLTDDVDSNQGSWIAMRRLRV